MNGIDTPTLTNAGYTLNNHFTKVDTFTDLTGAVATIFALQGDDFVRVSTSLKKEDGSRAMGTFLGKNSPAYEPIMQKKQYIGSARLFGKENCELSSSEISILYDECIVAMRTIVIDIKERIEREHDSDVKMFLSALERVFEKSIE